MSQEGANLPQEVEGSPDQATAPHGSIPAGVTLPMATVMPASSNSSSISKLASTVDNTGSSERASPAMLSIGDDNATASSNITSPVVHHAGKENKAEFKLASPAVLLAGKEKGSDDAGPKLASQAMLHDCDNSKDGSHAGVNNNNAQSKLASPVVLHVGDGKTAGSKITSPAVPPTTVEDTTDSKLDSPAMLIHASKDKDNNMGRPKFTSSVLPHAGVDIKARNKLSIQAASHVGSNDGLSRITRSAAALHATKHNVKLTIPVVPRPHASMVDNNTGSSKATRSATVDAGESNAKEGKNNTTGKQRAHVDMGSGRGKGNVSAEEDADHDVHIFTERERRKKMKNMFSTLHGLLPQLPDKADKATIVGEAVAYIKTLEGTVQKLERLKLERKRALAAQQQQQLAVGAAGSSSRVATARQPAPAPAASSREANLADMVHGLEAQQAAVAAANRTLAAAAAAAAGAGAGGPSATAGATGAPAQLPRGAVPFAAPVAGFQTWSGQNVVVSVAKNEAYINLHIPRQPGSLTKALFVMARHRLEVVTTTISAQDGFRMYGIHARANPAPASARFPENLSAEDRFKLAVAEMLQLISTN